MIQLSRNELVELVSKIINCEGTEEEIDEMISVVEKNIPHPEISNLIFWDEKTPEEIVDLALSYKSIQL